jgi:hypothetical protein
VKVKKKHNVKLRAHGVRMTVDIRPFDRFRADGTWIGNRKLRILPIEKNRIIFYTSGTYGITIA